MWEKLEWENLVNFVNRTNFYLLIIFSGPVLAIDIAYLPIFTL